MGTECDYVGRVQDDGAIVNEIDDGADVQHRDGCAFGEANVGHFDNIASKGQTFHRVREWVDGVSGSDSDGISTDTRNRASCSRGPEVCRRCRQSGGRDLRNIYLAATVLDAEDELQKFGKKWNSKHPTISKQCECEMAPHHFDV